MDSVMQFLSIMFPAGLVLIAMYLAIKSFLDKDIRKKLYEIQLKNKELILPTRLQAYERVVLFLERISPNNSVLRLSVPGASAGQLQFELLTSIRDEFNHNMSQQVYMSDEAWTAVKNAMDTITAIINNAASQIPQDAKNVELAKAIFNLMAQQEIDPIQVALTVVKNEIRQLF